MSFFIIEKINESGSRGVSRLNYKESKVRENFYLNIY